MVRIANGKKEKSKILQLHIAANFWPKINSQIGKVVSAIGLLGIKFLILNC